MAQTPTPWWSNGAATIDLSRPTRVGDTAEVTGFENVDASGSSAAVTLTGDGGANVLTGGSGDDTIVGGAGADTLERWRRQRHGHL